MPNFSRYGDHGLSALRIVSGLLFLGHGVSKLFAFPPSPMPSPATLSIVWWAGLIELVCGILITLGLWTRVAAFIASGQMAVAYFMYHAPNGFYPIANKGELAILYCFLFLYLALRGGGSLSIDSAILKKRSDAA